MDDQTIELPDDILVVAQAISEADPRRSDALRAIATEVSRLKAEVARLKADRDRLEAAALEQAERFRRAEAEITSLTDELFEQAELRGRAEGEARALIESRIGPYRGGGYVVWLPWRSTCSPGGPWLNNGLCHFDDRAAAVAAIRVSAGLDGGGTGA
jgi:outer membrane murein-binding lipoprotein Lpp